LHRNLHITGSYDILQRDETQQYQYVQFYSTQLKDIMF